MTVSNVQGIHGIKQTSQFINLLRVVHHPKGVADTIISDQIVGGRACRHRFDNLADRSRSPVSQQHGAGFGGVDGEELLIMNEDEILAVVP